jgi:HAD superfamily hydrolase (TIGR01509 family)
MKTKNPVQAILFDLDGTLIDTEPSAAKAVEECFQKWNLSIHPDDATYVTGRTWQSAFDYLFGKYSIPLPPQQAQKTILDRYRFHIENHLTAVPGSVEAVQNLAPHYPLGLVSGSGRTEILWALKKLEIHQHFQIILGAEDYPKSKPHPDGYRKAMETLGILPNQCLVFEDSTAGISSARAAGTWVVAVTSTNHFRQDTTQAHFQIPDLQDVNPSWIQNLSFD